MINKIGAVIRYTDESTYDIVYEALLNDPYIGEIKTVKDQYPLYKAAAETHKIFSSWIGKYPFVISIDADVVPFPGFGKWILKIVKKYPFPKYSRWLPPLLDWVVQGQWRTAGGIFCYKTEETAGLYEKYMKVVDLVEPEHNYDVFSGFLGQEWRPPLEQTGEIVSIHQYGQDLSIYFYRGIIHTLRIKDWIRPNVLLLAEKGLPEYMIFLEGIKWGLKNRKLLLSEDASFRKSKIFNQAFKKVLSKLKIKQTQIPRTYHEFIKKVIAQIPKNIYPIK